MKLYDVMRPSPPTIGEGDTLGDAHRAMVRARVRHLPVTDEGALVGMLSECDVLAARARAAADDDWWAVQVGDAMRMPVKTGAPGDSLAETAERMVASALDALPIIERGRLVGLVTVADVLAAEVRDAKAPQPAGGATVADAMTPQPWTIAPDATLADAIARMADHHIRHLPVVAAAHALVGMISERDVQSALSDLGQRQFDARHTHVRISDLMSRPVVSVSATRSLADVARQLADTRLGALPVVDDEGALVGILSYVDALRFLAS